MKNQYFGDVNDYLKYGLLRCFINEGLSIGVCWMLTPNDGRTDGRKISYLSEPGSWRSCDSALFDVLARAVGNHRRHVRQAQNSACLSKALFFKQIVPDDRLLRERWLGRALSKLMEADLLFFDPDNGIEVRSKPKGSRDSSKYLYWDEIQVAWRQPSSLLIFQHFPRRNHQQFASSLRSRLHELIGNGEVTSLVTSNVVYLLACKPKHQVRVRRAIDDVSENWSGRISTLS